MTTYIVHATNQEHYVDADTYVNGVDGLRFIRADGVTVALFTLFDWMKVRSSLAEVAVQQESQS